MARTPFRFRKVGGGGSTLRGGELLRDVHIAVAVLAAQDAQLSGSGEVTWVATGALNAQSASIGGAGFEETIGAGALVCQEALLSGQGLVQTIEFPGGVIPIPRPKPAVKPPEIVGHGVLVCGRATVDGEGWVYGAGEQDVMLTLLAA